MKKQKEQSIAYMDVTAEPSMPTIEDPYPSLHRILNHMENPNAELLSEVIEETLRDPFLRKDGRERMRRLCACGDPSCNRSRRGGKWVPMREYGMPRSSVLPTEAHRQFMASRENREAMRALGLSHPYCYCGDHACHIGDTYYCDSPTCRYNRR